MRRIGIFLLGTLLLCLAMNARQWHHPNLADFQVYDAAAELVHEHNSVHIYDGADSGAVFDLKFVDTQAPLGQAARRLGIPRVRLYIYPPILADLVLPLSFVSAATAGKLWLAINVVSLFAIAALMVRLLGLPWFGLGSLAVLVGLFSMYATGMCLLWGQITVVLLLLWLAGIAFYMRGWHAASALVFALATVIKLTPLIIVVPLLLWREWAWLRAYAGFLVGFTVLMLLVNTPASLTDYVFHVMPSMSGGGIPNFENKSLLSCLQLLYVTFHHGNPLSVATPIPHWVVTLGKALSLAVMVLAVAWVARLGRSMAAHDRRMTLALFALLSVCVAPISWKHAYIAAFLPLCLLWAEAFRQRASNLRLAVLTFCSIELGSFFFDQVLAKAVHGPLFGLLCSVAPATGIVLVLYRLRQMQPLAGTQPGPLQAA